MAATTTRTQPTTILPLNTQAPHYNLVEEATPFWPLSPAGPHAGRMENPAFTIEIAKAGCI